MKKINFLILSFISFILLTTSVYAGDFSFVKDENGEVKKVVVTGHAPTIEYSTWDRDGNILLIMKYQEADDPHADNDYLIPGATDIPGGEVIGRGTHTQTHAKIVKIDAGFNKVFETDFWEKGNWKSTSTSFQKGSTVQTTLTDISQLSDGSYVAVGNVWGLISPLGDTVSTDAIYVRLDQAGKEIYRKLYHSVGLKRAYDVMPLVDGGYIIKYYYSTGIFALIEPTDFQISDKNSNIQYIVYDSDDNVVEVISKNNISKLNEYDFLDEKDKIDYSSYSGSTYYETYESEHGELGTNGDDRYYLYQNNINGISSDNIKISYSKSTWLTKRTINIIGMAYEDDDFALDMDAYQKVYDSGEMFNLNTNNQQGVILMKNYPKENDANFVINGQKISYPMDIFIENDRTYIGLTNLCAVLDCEFYRSEKDNNKLIMQFDIFNGGNNKMVDYFSSSNYRIGEKVKYTVVHEIGSYEYTSYLSFKGMKNFRLNSPAYDQSKVDVVSKEIDGEVYIPLRFISEALGRYVSYEPGKDGEKPTITISAYGEGEFYDQYDVVLSYSKLGENDKISSTINETSFELDWGLAKLVYAYGRRKADNTVVSLDKTIFMPTQDKLLTGPNQFLEYTGTEDGVTSHKFEWLLFESEGNWIGKQEAYKDDHGKEGDKYFGSGEYEGFLAISNIEGYPFLKIVNFK